MADPFCICGIDPGLSGAIAFFFPAEPNRVTVEDMPVLNGCTDEMTLFRRLEQFRPDAVVIEIQHPMAKQGLGSTFRTGDNYGAVRGAVAGLRTPTFLIKATDWQRHFKIAKADKEKSRELALRLFPITADHFRRKMDHGRAEAALIARYHAENRMAVAA